MSNVSDQTRRRILVLGVTGLVGSQVALQARAHPQVRLFAISRRVAAMPQGARIENLVVDPSEWGEAIARLAPDGVICALGTTWKKAGRDEDAFRAVDQNLIVASAAQAKDAGARNFVLVSAAGADPHARALYSRVKAETEEAVAAIGFRRVDILRPGLLKGERTGDFRLLERTGQLLEPLVAPFLPSRFQAMRSIEAMTVASAALPLACQDAAGLFEHDNDAMAKIAAGIAPVGAR